MAYTICSGCSEEIIIPDELAGGLLGYVEGTYYCDACEPKEEDNDEEDNDDVREVSEICQPDLSELDAIGMGPACPKCGNPTDWLICWNCGGEGGRDGYEEDPLWYDEGDIIPCCECNGKGGWWRCSQCRECFDSIPDNDPDDAHPAQVDDISPTGDTYKLG